MKPNKLTRKIWNVAYSFCDLFGRKRTITYRWYKPVPEPYRAMLVCPHCNKGFINTKRFIRTNVGYCCFCLKELNHDEISKWLDEEEKKSLDELKQREMN